MNSAIATTGGSSGGESGSIGVGFAIPIDQVKITADQILRTGEARYPVIGATVDTGGSHRRRRQDPEGQLRRARRDKAGLRKGDVVTEVAGEKVADGIALIVAIRAHQPGDTIAVHGAARRLAAEPADHPRLRDRLTLSLTRRAARPSRRPR